MNLASEINELLDRLSESHSHLNEIKNEYNNNPQFSLKDSKTGEPVTKDFVLSTASGVIQEIKDNLNKTTDNGRRVKDIFTNDYYINDMSQDKIIADKIRANKLVKEESNQNKEKN